MKFLLALAIIATTSSGAFAQRAIPKNGNCPSGYVSAGEYCVPNRHARPAIDKRGQCPQLYQPNGNYCVAEMIPKGASCPNGYARKENYCVER